jgi:hypothetical protein
LTPADVVVLRFRGRRVPRGLVGLPVHDVTNPADVDPLVGARRMVVLGATADLGTVLTRLLRADRLDVEVGLVKRPWHARRARTAEARRVPLIRDETGAVVTEAAFWLPPDEDAQTITGECVVDDISLFDGEVTGVRIEPTADPPGLRASVLTRSMRPRRWVAGRAAQLGTTSALVVRDGVAAPRPVRRSTFYRHTHGWLAVR